MRLTAPCFSIANILVLVSLLSCLQATAYGQATGTNRRPDAPVRYSSAVSQAAYVDEEVPLAWSSNAMGPQVHGSGSIRPSSRIPHTLIGRSPATSAGARFIDPVFAPGNGFGLGSGFAPGAGRGIVETAVDSSLSSDPDQVQKRALKNKLNRLTHPAGHPRFPIIDAHHSIESEWRYERGHLRSAEVQQAWKSPYSYGYFGAGNQRHWNSHQDYRDRSTQWRFE